MSLVCREFDKNCTNNHLYNILFNQLVSMPTFPALFIFYIPVAKYQYEIVEQDIKKQEGVLH